MSTHQTLLEKHQSVDYLCRHPEGRVFVSDWYCQHPYTKEYLPPLQPTPRDLLYYCFQNDTDDIHKEITTFHKRNDGIVYEKDEIFVGAGMTPLLTAQVMLMKARGVKKIYYTKPLYYMFYYMAKVLDLELIPVCDIPLNQPNIKLNFPKEKSWMVICDPLWYMGKNFLPGYVKQIKNWQEATGSHIIVDGAFQYMKWDKNDRHEETATLNKELTLRSVCPTKALALHGIRFSYTLLPKAYQEEMRYNYANSFGSSCIYSHEAAKHIMRVLNSPTSNFALLDYIQDRYRHYKGLGVFSDPIGADCTYFIFVRLLGDVKKYIMMDQDFFDTTNYPGLARFNLLLPHTLPTFETNGINQPV